MPTTDIMSHTACTGALPVSSTFVKLCSLLVQETLMCIRDPKKTHQYHLPTLRSDLGNQLWKTSALPTDLAGQPFFLCYIAFKWTQYTTSSFAPTLTLPNSGNAIGIFLEVYATVFFCLENILLILEAQYTDTLQYCLNMGEKNVYCSSLWWVVQ